MLRCNLGWGGEVGLGIQPAAPALLAAPCYSPESSQEPWEAQGSGFQWTSSHPTTDSLWELEAGELEGLRTGTGTVGVPLSMGGQWESAGILSPACLQDPVAYSYILLLS